MAVAGIILSAAACGTLDSAYESSKAGIAALQPGMEAWHGHRFDELVEAWGEPSSQLQLGNDLVAYMWQSAGTECQRTFTVRDGKIVGSSDTDC